MRHLARITVDGIEYALTVQSGCYYLHKTDVEAQFAGETMEIDPEALAALSAGFAEAQRIHEIHHAAIKKILEDVDHGAR